ncbi:MAG: cytochrome C [Desulfobacteraceae bacterium]|nr:cytochrome C [Desulfobacteraceae bacterium]
MTTITALIFAAACYGVATMLAPDTEGRADIIIIDAVAAFGDLERSGVIFYHSRHTQALEKSGKDCSACHQTMDGRLSPKFMRVEDISRSMVMDTYHDNCISCHQDTLDAGEKSGPVTCGECHIRESAPMSTRRPMGLDKSLHYRHAKALDNKCEQCHHEYDEGAKKLFYAEGKEGACLYCHRTTAEENRISLKDASHQDCIGCHLERTAKNLDAGPVTCLGCHDPAEQKIIEKADNLPRLKRKQPDAVLLRAASAGDGGLQSRMDAVAFNHKAHEAYNDSCKVCHHAELMDCRSCHTQTGSEKGNHIKLERAMHQTGVDTSCIGCHTREQQAIECAGCHSAIVKSPPQQQAYCKTCHATPSTAVTAAGNPAQVETARIAQQQLDSRKPMYGTYADADIPDIVIIGQLVSQYEAVELPHRKIVTTLVRNLENSKLAAYFHADPGTVCQGCHHNSPPAEKPPLCASCHGVPFDEKNPSKPGLSGAYHQQCMNCHDRMGIVKPDSRDCESCHKEKK